MSDRETEPVLTEERGELWRYTVPPNGGGYKIPFEAAQQNIVIRILWHIETSAFK